MSKRSLDWRVRFKMSNNELDMIIDWCREDAEAEKKRRGDP